MVTQIFRLNYESATNLVPVLRPLITPNNTITAYPSNNSLVITDYAGNLKRLGQVIANLDSPSTSEIEVLTIQHAVASDVAVAVSRMVDESARGGPGAQVDPGQRIAVLADPRMNTVMLRSSSQAKMNLAKTLIMRLDQPSARPGNINVVYLRNAEAVRLAQVLRGVLSGDAGGGLGTGAGGFGSATSAAASAARESAGRRARSARKAIWLRARHRGRRRRPPAGQPGRAGRPARPLSARAARSSQPTRRPIR